MVKAAIHSGKMGEPKSGIPMTLSPAIKAGNLLFISGTVALDSKGKLVGEGDPAAQASQVYENIKALLEAAGGSMKDVVKQTVYITNVQHADRIREVRRKYYSPPFPASATVEVSNLAMKGALIEVEAIAVIE